MRARSLSAVSEAPTSEDLSFRCAVKGRFRYSDLKEAAPRAPLQELRNRSSYTQPRRFCVRQRDRPTTLAGEHSSSSIEARSSASERWKDRLAYLPAYLLNHVAQRWHRYQGAAGTTAALDHPKHNERLHPGHFGAKTCREQ